MPPRRKVDLLPEELRARIKDALRARGFSGYEELTADINDWLDEAGLELRIGKSAVHAFGVEYEKLCELQDEAGAWAKEWMSESDLSDEADRHRVLFKMMTTLAFKALKAQVNKEGDEIDPRELHFLGRMMKDVMHSSGIREQIMVKERARIAAEERTNAVEALEAQSEELGLSSGVIDKLKREFLGVRNGGE